MSATDYRVVVGIDFGTTYSGAAYGILSSQEVADVGSWPKQAANRYPKTPTVSLYSADTRKLVAWGNAARQRRAQPTSKGAHIFLNQYKLYLDDSLDGVLPPPEGFKALNLIADYLRELHKHVLSEMKRGFAQQFDERTYRYCLTVPAMWSDKAKQAMRETAILAGIIRADDPHDRLILISEPEAAAIYCEKAIENFDLNDGDEFMICDAGGGTVDLIVFSVKMGSDGTRRFKESTKGVGKSCGSVFVDRRMRKLLRSKLRRVVETIPPAALETMMETFTETLKPAFDGTDDLYLTLPMSLGLTEQSDQAIGLDDGNLRFTVQELKERVFEPVVQDVLALVYTQKQQAHNLKTIFTVGGFGASQYLQRRIAEEYKRYNIRVIAPFRAELAVARGAAYLAMNPNKVTTRVPRYWYGIGITNTFVEGVDPEAYKIVRQDGSVRCDNRFSVFVRRGEPLDIDSCITQKYTTYYPCPTACTFYAASTEDEPRYTLQPGVHRVFDFEIPMPVLPDAIEGDRIDLIIKMYFGEVELRVEAVIRGQTYRVVCNFDMTNGSHI